MHGKTMRADGSGAECGLARPSARQPRRVSTRWVPLLAGLTALPWAAPAQAAEHLSFLDPQGPIAAAARDHFILVTAVLLIFVALPVFIGTLWVARRYRYGAGKGRYTPKWMFYKPIEYFTWAGPVAIVLLLSTMVWRSATALDPYAPIPSSQAPLRVQVVGYDWKWLFVYPEQGIASVDWLALPAGRPVTLELTSATVMQSFFIPALASQIYAMGGMVTQLNLQADRPGRFLGENTMYNGDGFHQQKFPAVAMSSADFDAWVHTVRGSAPPLGAAALAQLARPGTGAQLRAALPAASPPDGPVVFSGVAPHFFSDLVMAAMHGPAHAAKPAHAPMAMASTPAAATP